MRFNKCSDCGIAKQETDNWEPEYQCPDCQKKFHILCDRYRAMKKSVEGKGYKEQLDAINKFRCGEW